ncbi:MAG: metallophosphoesterase family protein [Planctomycetota bacterium]|nr:metallophosphoesterase family protein [Planctomycetota bacterium]MCZ6692218.1 metallophosphoesterase family protein [Planctomycetota bacterium]
MFAVVSDIHSNLEAMEAVLKDMQRHKPDEIYCTGDIVGYGPSPEEIVDIAREKFKFTVMGNHEWAVLHQPVGFNQAARDASRWTREVLEPKWFNLGGKRERWSFLKSLPEVYIEGKYFFVHGSPQSHMEEYLLPTEIDEVLKEASPKINAAFDAIEWVCFNGHTHHPGIMTQEPRFVYPHQIEGSFRLEEGKKYIVNVGSVGQPRDGDPRACYVTVDDHTVTYHRVEYDLEATIARVKQNSRLHPALGERLRKGS